MVCGEKGETEWGRGPMRTNGNFFFKIQGIFPDCCLATNENIPSRSHESGLLSLWAMGGLESPGLNSWPPSPSLTAPSLPKDSGLAPSYGPPLGLGGPRQRLSMDLRRKGTVRSNLSGRGPTTRGLRPPGRMAINESKLATSACQRAASRTLWVLETNV